MINKNTKLTIEEFASILEGRSEFMCACGKDLNAGTQRKELVEHLVHYLKSLKKARAGFRPIATSKDGKKILGNFI